MLVQLDRLAARYHTDPASILQWDPERLGLALECLAAGEALRDRRVAQIAGGEKMPFVFDVSNI